MIKHTALALWLSLCFALGGYIGDFIHERLSEQPCFIIPPSESISTTTLEPTP